MASSSSTRSMEVEIVLHAWFPLLLSAEVEINLHVWLPRVLLSVWRNEKVSTRGSLEFYLQYGGGYNYSRVAPLSTLGVEAKPDTSPRVAP